MIKSIFIILVIFVSNYTFSQNYEEIIEDLNSDNIYDPIGATDLIIIYNIQEAFNVINDLYDAKPPIVQSRFLIALQLFEDPKLYERLIDYIDRADNFINEEYPLDPLTEKVHATYLLFKLEDYQTYQYVFDLITRDGVNNLNPEIFNSLEIILNNIPSAEIEAKNILLSIWESNEDESYHYLSISILVEKYGTEMTNRLLDAFENDDYLPVRILSLEYLFELEYEGLNSLLKDRLSKDSEWSFRVDIADSLLTRFGEPSDLIAVIDYQPNEPDETAKSLMGYAIDEFIPPNPASLNLLGKVTKLISYASEIYSYQWIANTQTRDYYLTKLNLLKRQIERGQYKDACTTVNNDLLARIETDLTANNITIEGYKFLHYYCMYIKEDFPQGLDPCP